jgi:hypothetical protein
LRKDSNHAVILAIKSAEASLKMARQLLGGQGGKSDSIKDLSNLKYIEGVFDGTHMVGADGKKYQVNSNYATKSMLVCGDKLRAYDENGKYWFKQVDKVKREKTSGMITKKANVWHVVTSGGSYKVSPEAVEFLNLDVGDEVGIFLPASNKRVPFATLDFVKKVRKSEKANVAKDSKEQGGSKDPKEVLSEIKGQETVKREENKEKEAEKEKPSPKEEEKKKEQPKKRSVEKKVQAPKKEKTEKKKSEKKVTEKVVLEEGDLR